MFYDKKDKMYKWFTFRNVTVFIAPDTRFNRKTVACISNKLLDKQEKPFNEYYEYVLDDAGHPDYPYQGNIEPKLLRDKEFSYTPLEAAAILSALMDSFNEKHQLISFLNYIHESFFIGISNLIAQVDMNKIEPTENAGYIVNKINEFMDMLFYQYEKDAPMIDDLIISKSFFGVVDYDSRIGIKSVNTINESISFDVIKNIFPYVYREYNVAPVVLYSMFNRNIYYVKQYIYPLMSFLLKTTEYLECEGLENRAKTLVRQFASYLELITMHIPRNTRFLMRKNKFLSKYLFREMSREEFVNYLLSLIPTDVILSKYNVTGDDALMYFWLGDSLTRTDDIYRAFLDAKETVGEEKFGEILAALFDGEMDDGSFLYDTIYNSAVDLLNQQRDQQLIHNVFHTAFKPYPKIQGLLDEAWDEVFGTTSIEE